MLEKLILELKKSINFTDINRTKTVYKGSIRSWGTWEFPEYEDEEEEQDYDWNVLSQESVKQLDNLESKLSAKFPKYNINFQVEEKEWLYVTIERK